MRLFFLGKKEQAGRAELWVFLKAVRHTHWANHDPSSACSPKRGTKVRRIKGQPTVRQSLEKLSRKGTPKGGLRARLQEGCLFRSSKLATFFGSGSRDRSLVVSFLLLLILLMPLSCATTGSNQSRAEQARFVEEIKQEIELGRLVAAKVIARYGQYKNQDIIRYINLVGKGIAMYNGRPELNYSFTVLDTEVINAFAAPGGYVMITKGLIKNIHDESELASVLAHEIAHINRKHMMKRITMPKVSRSFAERLASVMGASNALVSSAFGQIADQAQKVLFESGYNIADEYDADEYGLKYAYFTGYDADGLQRFLQMLQRFETKHGKDKAYNTHPSAQSRLQKLGKIKRTHGLSGGAKAESRFQEYKRMIKD